MNENCFEAIDSYVLHHMTKSIHSSCDHLGYDMTKNHHNGITARLIIILADLMKEQ